jgi:2-polyprenyl-3-methyl-5-hydroxy-6-metoxy-1,4-benzoquinol methylase
MSKAKKNYYNEAYTVRDIRKSPLPTLTMLSSILKRFDLPAHQLTLDLLSPNDKILDLGCGDGVFALSAKKKFSEVYGIDISDVAIELATKSILKREDKSSFHFSTYDADESLPFQDSFFDAITCLAVLEHATHPPSFLQEMKRVLKKSGELVILIPNDAWLPYRLQYFAGKIPASGAIDEIGADWGHLHKFNQELICSLLSSIGFHITDITCSGIFAKPRKKWLSLLAGNIIVKALKH